MPRTRIRMAVHTPAAGGPRSALCTASVSADLRNGMGGAGGQSDTRGWKGRAGTERGQCWVVDAGLKAHAHQRGRSSGGLVIDPIVDLLRRCLRRLHRPRHRTGCGGRHRFLRRQREGGAPGNDGGAKSPARHMGWTEEQQRLLRQTGENVVRSALLC